MKRKKVLGFAVAFCTLSLAVSAIFIAKGNPSFNKAVKADTYTKTLNSAVFGASELTTEYQQLVTQKTGDPLKGAPVLNYALAKKDASNNLVLAPNGRVYNYYNLGSHGQITNIKAITVEYTGGKLYVQSGISGTGITYGEKTQFTSGTRFEFIDSPNYIMISNTRQETTISSITVDYTCTEGEPSVYRLGEQYRGAGSDGTQYVLNREGNNVTIGDFSGTINVNNDGTFAITLASGAVTYSGTVSADSKTLTITGKTGPAAEAAPTIAELNRIYVMDDFESYEGNGTGYAGKANLPATLYSAADLKAAYYSDYGGGGSTTWISGSNFNVCTSSDYINLNSTVVHTGSKSMTIKGITGSWMRFWSIDTFNQNQHFNFGSGNVFSFWAHGAYTNVGTTSEYSKDVTVRAQVYYQNFEITDSNRSSATYGTGTKDFTIKSGSDWKEYRISLNPAKKVYAVNFMINNSGLASNVYVPIDDLSIYTRTIVEQPKQYTESATRFTKTYNGVVDTMAGEWTIKIGLGANGYVYGWAGGDMKPKSYTVEGNQITIVNEGSYVNDTYHIDATYGTWVGTLSEDRTSLTFNKADITGGTVTNYINSTTITLQEDNVLADGSEGTAALQARFKRQYMYSGSWTDDTSNTDRLAQVSTHHIQGENAISIRAYGSGAMRIMINPTVAEAQSANIKSVAFWYYVPASVDYLIRVYSYNSYTPGTDYKMVTEKSYSDGVNTGWHYLNLGLAEGYGKNFTIFVNNCTVASVVDYITYF